jgi:hypothetical protein
MAANAAGDGVTRVARERDRFPLESTTAHRFVDWIGAATAYGEADKHMIGDFREPEVTQQIPEMGAMRAPCGLLGEYGWHQFPNPFREAGVRELCSQDLDAVHQIIGTTFAGHQGGEAVEELAEPSRLTGVEH